MYEMMIDLQPMGQERHRAIHKNGKTWTYDPDKSKKWKKECKALMSAFVEENKVEMCYGPTLVSFIAFTEMSKSASKKAKSEWLLNDNKPDNDNIEKILLDSGSGILWADDKSIVLNAGLSVRIPNGHKPCVILTWGEIGDDSDIIANCKTVHDHYTGGEDELE